jgi:hypothetical protein
MKEERKADRVKSLLRARIIYNQRLSTVDCVVKNISTEGAKLAIAQTVVVPAVFELDIPQKGKTYHAKMVWRDADAIGVEFVSAEAPSEEGMPDHSSAHDLETRLRALQLQNAELKIRVRELSKRLEDLGQDPNIAA